MRRINSSWKNKIKPGGRGVRRRVVGPQDSPAVLRGAGAGFRDERECQHGFRELQE